VLFKHGFPDDLEIRKSFVLFVSFVVRLPVL